MATGFGLVGLGAAGSARADPGPPPHWCPGDFWDPAWGPTPVNCRDDWNTSATPDPGVVPYLPGHHRAHPGAPSYPDHPGGPGHPDHPGGPGGNPDHPGGPGNPDHPGAPGGGGPGAPGGTGGGGGIGGGGGGGSSIGGGSIGGGLR
ncbi:hypothetical protein [Mycobacterium sherrisii]|uniref:hypothetical protein n=1 Tax=Mycobacterium sherrisii TaxID=243061 RepID=UPI000A14CCA6|nr:hypothetical protein [Mycobacterium sherrisii]MCV7031207.1 hypothetical protein [Mycobacterium sherrisii]